MAAEAQGQGDCPALSLSIWDFIPSTTGKTTEEWQQGDLVTLTV